MASLIILCGVSLGVLINVGGNMFEKTDQDISLNGESLEVASTPHRLTPKSVKQNPDTPVAGANKKDDISTTQHLPIPERVKESPGARTTDASQKDDVTRVSLRGGTYRLELVSVNRIWGGNSHDAFTSLAEHNGILYCAFRHSSGHNTRDGKIKVIKSQNGSNWEEMAILSVKGKDLRDPKLSINSGGELVLVGLGRSSAAQNNRHVTYTWRFRDGRWSDANLDTNSENTWKWGVGRVDNQIYSIAYSGKDKHGTLYRSRNGQKWEKVSDRIFPDIKDYPNESAFVEIEGKSILCLLRKNEGNKRAKLGVSKPPYKTWDWKDLDKQIGGPSLIRLPNGDIYACVRLYQPVRTSICRVDVENGRLVEMIKLPSGNDTSYAGMVLFNGQLYISYYSNHETGKGKSAIYLAKIKI